jgi:hypothetical protein
VLRVTAAALKAARCTALRSATQTAKQDTARSSRATGSPQANSAPRLNVTEATGASALDRPGVTIGQMSPSTIMVASTQNCFWCTTTDRSVRWVIVSPNATAPATVHAVMWNHSGEPTRGPMSLVSFGSFMAPRRPAGR